MPSSLCPAHPPASRRATRQSLEADKSSGERLLLRTGHVVRMKESEQDLPYTFVRGPVAQWAFTLAYASLPSLLVPAARFLAACRLPRWERDAALAADMAQRVHSLVFDTSRLSHHGERVLFSCPAAQVAPLAAEQGRFLVSNAGLYFQPIHNLGADSPVRGRPLTSLVAVARRRYALQPVALELFFTEAADRRGQGGWEAAASVMLSFAAAADCEAAAAAIASTPGGAAAAEGGQLLEGNPARLAMVQNAWVKGELSNFMYLLFLNLAAGRTFNDLSQWPVFPFVLSNYSSDSLDLNDPRNFRCLAKPIGALNPKRLHGFRERSRELSAAGEPSFLYGTHYSTPGFTLYWLVRAAPGHMLRLQGGRFDVPDRLFNSIGDAWESVNTGPADVKELIPEFYCLPAPFLVNGLFCPFGTRQSGCPVGDVGLPPWANGSPDRFIALHRAALEAPCASAELHAWIDLIFGVAQRGREAERRDNVFHPLSYDTPQGDLDMDPEKRAAKLAHIAEYGQTPRQIFKSAHPSRRCFPPVLDEHAAAAAALGGASTTALLQTLRAVIGPITHVSELPLEHPKGGAEKLEQMASPVSAVPAAASMLSALTARRLAAPMPAFAQSGWAAHRAHRGGVAAIAVAGRHIYSAGSDAQLKVWCGENEPTHCVALGRLSLASLALAGGDGDDAHPLCLGGSFDNSIYGYSVTRGSVLFQLAAHDDTVSALAMSQGLLVSASWDGSVRCWELGEDRCSAHAVPSCMLEAHEGPVWAVASEQEGPFVASAGACGCVGWDRRLAEPAWRAPWAARGVALTPDGRGAVLACEDDGMLRLLDMRCLGGEAASMHCQAPPLCCAVSDSFFAAAGTATGEAQLWAFASPGQASGGVSSLSRCKFEARGSMSSGLNAVAFQKTDGGEVLLVGGSADGSLCSAAVVASTNRVPPHTTTTCTTDDSV